MFFLKIEIDWSEGRDWEKNLIEFLTPGASDTKVFFI